MSWIEAQLQETEKHVQQEILHARDQGQRRRRKLICEVYAGEGKITSLLQAHGDVEVMRFGLKDGWEPNHRKQLRLCDDLEPGEIYMSPKCTLWSRVQQINVTE